MEFLALSEDTSRFNLAIVTIAPGRSGPEAHSHQHEDDAFFLLEGELTFTVEDETLAAGPGTLCARAAWPRPHLREQGLGAGPIPEYPRAGRVRQTPLVGRLSGTGGFAPPSGGNRP